jgi:hypothetical protein
MEDWYNQASNCRGLRREKRRLRKMPVLMHHFRTIVTSATLRHPWSSFGPLLTSINVMILSFMGTFFYRLLLIQ